MFAFLTNRIVVVQLTALTLAAITAAGWGPPGATTDPAKITAAIMLAAGAVSAVLRFGHPGAQEADAKAWWQSRTIWTQVVAAAYALAALAGIAPASDQASAVEWAMGAASLATVLAARRISRPIGSPIAAIAGSAFAITATLVAILVLGGCTLMPAGSAGRIAAVAVEAGIAADIAEIDRRLGSTEPASEEQAAAMLARLDGRYAALLVARAINDAAHPRSGRLADDGDIQAREKTDLIYERTRMRLMEWR